MFYSTYFTRLPNQVFSFLEWIRREFCFLVWNEVVALWLCEQQGKTDSRRWWRLFNTFWGPILCSTKWDYTLVGFCVYNRIDANRRILFLWSAFYGTLYSFSILFWWIVDVNCWLICAAWYLYGRQSSASFYTLFLLYYISSYADFCFFITVYCLTLCIAWYWLTQFFYRQTSAFFLSIILLYSDWYCLTLPDADWTQIHTGHSALRTMWLSAPVLAYVPVDIDTDVCATPTA